MFKIIVLLSLFAFVYSQTTVRPVCSRNTEECGGIHQTKCCLGQQLQCKYHTPIHPEATGVCQKVCMAEGQRCLGFTLDPQFCCSGLKCVTDERIPDLPGICKNQTIA